LRRGKWKATEKYRKGGQAAANRARGCPRTQEFMSIQANNGAEVKAAVGPRKKKNSGGSRPKKARVPVLFSEA